MRVTGASRGCRAMRVSMNFWAWVSLQLLVASGWIPKTSAESSSGRDWMMCM
jgi:hypothetical protein